MMTKCEECGENWNWMQRVECVCKDCGVVYENPLMDADTNSGSSLGEGRHNEAVNRNAAAQGAKHGGKMSVWATKSTGVETD